MKDYDALPMIMNADDIAAATRELLAEARADPRPNPRAVAEALVTMISRQSGTFTPFAPDLRAEMEAWVDEAWATAPLPLFDALATVAVNIETPRMRARLEAAARSTDGDVRAIANETLAEFPLP